ncbi:MAG TPA: response regulator [Thermoanaerobaculia bacterium]|nr:response regulator [Thermoanaerobaculia bacterium]
MPCALCNKTVARGTRFASGPHMLPERKGRVLVVDDEPAIRALVAKIVERAGFGVDVAADGAEAIDKVNKTDYAVIVLDLMMPAVSGYEFVDFLEQRGGKRPSVIVITAAAEASLTRQLDPKVVHSIVRKPFDINVLADLVAAAATTAETSADDTNVVHFRR